MPGPNELRVFISSTFRDMQEEREHLVKKIFPEIRALCRERGVTFTEVDLRWGLTDEDVIHGQVIRVCLEEIDRCRPYFIGITGERYGYVPEFAEYYKDPELLERYPWLLDAAAAGASILDLEFRHAVLNDPQWADQARFFVRRERRSLRSTEARSSEGSAERAAIAELIERVRAVSPHVVEFRDAATLGEFVYDELLEIIERDFARSTPLTPLEAERISHRAFAESRRLAYIPKADYLSRLNRWIESTDHSLLIVSGESGAGKSSLLSFWCDMARRTWPDRYVIEHYVGLGTGETGHLGIIRHIMEELAEQFDRREPIPTTAETLEQEFANWLGFSSGQPLLIAIDAVDQLTGRGPEQGWLPSVLPPGVKLLLSCANGEALNELRRRNAQELPLLPLSEGEREAAVVRFLAGYHKALARDQVRRIAHDPKVAHPLFLRTLLEELRLYSRHEHLDQAIALLLETASTEDLFQHVLERMENDYGTKSVREILALLWASRNGLDEEEVIAITAVGRLKLSAMLGGLDYHLVRRDGRLTFFHSYLRRAVESRYLRQDDDRRAQWGLLAEHFEQADASERAVLELVHAVNSLGDRERLGRILSDPLRFEPLWRGRGRDEVLRFWSSSTPETIVAAYESSFRRWESERTPSPAERVAVVRALAALYRIVGAWSAAEEMHRESRAYARDHGEAREEVAALTSLSDLARSQGRSDEAEELAVAAERIALTHGDRAGLAVALSHHGLIHKDRGAYDEALACFRESEQILREIGDLWRLGRVIGNRGVVYSDRSEYDLALECYQQTERIGRERGDRLMASTAVGNRGNIHWRRGEHELALACYAEQERIALELGNRQSQARAVGNRGLIHADRGEHDEALACYAEQERIADELGDQQTRSRAIGNRGHIHTDRGEYEKALACFAELEGIAKKAGDRRSLAQVIGSRGQIHAMRGEYPEAARCYRDTIDEYRRIGYRYGLAVRLHSYAMLLLDVLGTTSAQNPPPLLPEWLRDHVRDIDEETGVSDLLRAIRGIADECVGISREISRSEVEFSARVLLARITAAEGDPEGAVDELQRLLSAVQSEPQRAEAYYWLGMLSSGEERAVHRAEARRLYLMLHEVTPMQLYAGRIRELDDDPDNDEADLTLNTAR